LLVQIRGFSGQVGRYRGFRNDAADQSAACLGSFNEGQSVFGVSEFAASFS